MRQAHYNSPNLKIIDDIIEKFIQPLADGFWLFCLARSKDKIKLLDERIAKHEAVVACWIKFDKFDPAKSNKSINYFTQIISYLWLGENKKETLYMSRFFNESGFCLEDDQ